MIFISFCDIQSPHVGGMEVSTSELIGKNSIMRDFETIQSANIIFSFVMFQFSDVFKLENDLPDVRIAAKVR